jgi:S-layer family protein
MKSVMAGAVFFIGAVMATAGRAGAQEVEDWGTTATVDETYEASDFEIASGVYGGFDLNAARFCGNNAPCTWFAGVRLPTGALISLIELDACDTDPASQVAFGLLRNVKGGGVTTNLNGNLATTGATPGCGVFTATLSAPETVNNLNNNYFLEVVSGPNNLTKFKAIRIVYRLQVSGAPAVATFPNDVPTTHPFFKFVEALARAGITGGCAPGSFCPDNPVTRGQMAVFLATALGMHFAN